MKSTGSREVKKPAVHGSPDRMIVTVATRSPPFPRRETVTSLLAEPASLSLPRAKSTVAVEFRPIGVSEAINARGMIARGLDRR